MITFLPAPFHLGRASVLLMHFLLVVLRKEKDNRRGLTVWLGLSICLYILLLDQFVRKCALFSLLLEFHPCNFLAAKSIFLCTSCVLYGCLAKRVVTPGELEAASL